VGYSREARKFNEWAMRAKSDKVEADNLWFECEEMIRATIGSTLKLRGRLDLFDDSFQNSYFWFLKAIEKYSGDRGDESSFIVFMRMYIKYSCWDIHNKDRKKSNAHPRHKMEFLSFDNTRVDADGDIFNAISSIPDPSTDIEYLEIESNIVVDTIMGEVMRMRRYIERTAFIEVVYKERPIHIVASEIGVPSSNVSNALSRACRYLRSLQIIRALREEFGSYARYDKRLSSVSPYRTKGVGSFNSTFTSVVEDIVLSMEKYGIIQ
jgi:DNA-directed RNA polymerase specialized sigma24 family protein